MTTPLKVVLLGDGTPRLTPPPLSYKGPTGHPGALTPLISTQEEEGMCSAGRVGKTSLVCRFVHGTFDAGQLATVQAAFVTKTLTLRDRQQVEVAIWDTAGQERFHSLGPIYYRGAGVTHHHRQNLRGLY